MKPAHATRVKPLSTDAWPPALLEHIRRGGAVRTLQSDPLAGRCGAVAKRAKSGGFCTAAAGRGTTHRTIGRCSHHVDVVEGLAPWVGEVSAEQWKALTGAGGPMEGGRFVTTHGASRFSGLSFREIILQVLDPDDAAVFQAIPADPIQQLDIHINLLTVQVIRVHGWIRQEKLQAASRGQQVDMATVGGAEALAGKLAGNIARLHEVRAKYTELSSNNDSRTGLRELLQRLSPAEFSKVVSQPQLLSDFSVPTSTLLH